VRWKRAASLLALIVLLLAGVLALLSLPAGHQSLGRVPVVLAIDQRTARAFVANYGSDTVSILDATTGLVQRTQAVAGHPLAIAVDERGARVAVASEGPPGQPGTLTVLVAADGSALSTTRVGVGPAAVAVDPTTRHAFVLNLDGASLSTVEMRTGRTLRTTPIRLIDLHFVEHPACAGIIPLNVCYSNATAGRLIQFNERAWYVVHQHPGGLVVDERRHHLFVVATMNNTVDEFDTRTGTLLRTIPVGLAPCAMALDPQTGQSFVSNLDSDSVSVVDTVRGATLRTIAVGHAPSTLALDAHDGRIVTANQQDSTASIVDIRHPAAARTLPVGYAPTALAVD